MKKLFIFLIFVFLSGCSYKELDELAIASAFGIDYENGTYQVSAQILNLESTKESGENTSTIIYETQGKSIAEAIRNIGLKYPNTLYLGHLEILVIGKGVVENGINEIFDYFIRTTEARADSLLLISSTEKAFDILNPKNEEKSTIPAKDIVTTIKNSMDRNGKAVAINLEEFIVLYMKTGIDPVVTEINTTKIINEGYKDTTLTSIAAFSEGKYVGNLNNESSMAYNLLNNNFYDINVNSQYQNGIVSLAIFNPKSEIEVKIEQDKVNVTINAYVEGHILEIYDNSASINDEFIDALEKSTNEKLKEYIEELLSFCKEKNVDLLGIKNKLYQHYYKKYHLYKDKNIYDETQIKINVNSKIYRYGNSNNLIKEK